MRTCNKEGAFEKKRALREASQIAPGPEVITTIGSDDKELMTAKEKAQVQSKEEETVVPETVEEEEEEAQNLEDITPEPIPSLGGNDEEEDIPVNVEASGAEQQTPKGETKTPPPNYYGDKGWESHYNWINRLHVVRIHLRSLSYSSIHVKAYYNRGSYLKRVRLLVVVVPELESH